jgi:hypothetical protein
VGGGASFATGVVARSWALNFQTLIARPRENFISLVRSARKLTYSLDSRRFNRPPGKCPSHTSSTPRTKKNVRVGRGGGGGPARPRLRSRTETSRRRPRPSPCPPHTHTGYQSASRATQEAYRSDCILAGRRPLDLVGPAGPRGRGRRCSPPRNWTSLPPPSDATSPATLSLGLDAHPPEDPGFL